MGFKSNDVKFVECMLKNYKSMKAERHNLKLLNNLIETQKNFAIEGKYLKASTITDMPRHIDNQNMSKVFTTNNVEYNELCNQQSCVNYSIEQLDNVIKAITKSISTLDEKGKKVLILYYIKRKSISEISSVTNYSVRDICRCKHNSLFYLFKSLKIFKNNINFNKTT